MWKRVSLHEDAMKVLENHGSDVDDYIRLRNSIVSHEHALAVIEIADSPRAYIALRNSGINHEEAISFIENFSDSDMPDYLQLRKRVTHEVALDVLENSNAEEYLSFRNLGDSHEEAIRAVDEADIQDYISLRQRGVSPDQAVEVSINYNVPDYLRLLGRGLKHDEIIGILDR
ncbi:MAG: hypothetical protein R3A80_06660 [Bdellovibrionota bacterium]